MPLSHFVPAYPSPPRVLKSILYVCVFIPVLPLGFFRTILTIFKRQEVQSHCCIITTTIHLQNFFIFPNKLRTPIQY